MMRKSGLSILVLIISLQLVMAQSAKIEFTEETYDFGKVEETGGPVEHKFMFKNTGSSPLIIQDVKASCGCTTPSWTKEPVLPGKEGFITARYDPANRPGAFTKSLTVTTNADPNVSRVFIKGIVNPKPKTTEGEYPVEMGHIRMRYRSMHMGDVNTKDPVTKKFDVFNDSDKPITFLDKTDAPDFITVSYEPKTIPPNTEGKLVITYDGKKRNDFGTVIDNFNVYTDEETDNEKNIRLQANIKEYFPPMTAEQLANAPKLTIEDGTYDFGTINTGTKINTEFTITNTGKTELKIRTTKSTCSCVVEKMSKTSLSPGESATLKVTFDSTDRRGQQQKSVNIYSNDPQKPAQRVVIKGRVE